MRPPEQNGEGRLSLVLPDHSSMPIKFKCKCGHVLSVSSNMAGKKGKCPKCANLLRVPTPKAQSAGVNASASAPAGGALSQMDGALDSLLDDAGLTKKTGPTCPKCLKDVKPGAVICTSCGFNFESGEQMREFAASHEGPEFENLYLEEASRNMEREILMDTRRAKSQMPWWVIMSFLIGAMTACAAGIVIVEGNFGEPAPENTLIGKVQRWPVFTTLGLTATITGLAITVFAHLSITTFGFGKSVVQGLLCFFLPLIYSFVYGILNWVENKAPVKAIMMALVFIGLGVFLIIQGGGFNIVFNAFR